MIVNHRPALILAAALLFCSGIQATAADLLSPGPDSPRYQLSNLRTENDRFGKRVIAFDYKRTKAGTGSVSIKGRTADGELSISAYVGSQNSGTMRLSSFFGRGEISTDIELYFVQAHSTANGEKFGHVYSMVSNAIRRGNPGASPRPRAWTADEKAGAAEFVRIMKDDSAYKPPREYKVTVAPLEGFDFLANTVKVVKGTKLKACYQNNWHPLTVLSENDDGTVNTHWDKYDSSHDCSMKRGELIIEDAVAARLKKHPDSLYAKTVPNWATPAARDTKPPSPDAKQRKSYPVSIAVPGDSQFIPKNMKVKSDTPVQACWGGKWNPLTVISENDDGTLNVHWVKWGSSSDCSMVRSELIIHKKYLDPNYVEEVTIAPVEPAKTRKQYVVSIPVPADSQKVPNDVKLAVGTKLQACWAGKWNPITMLSHTPDGTLNVRWDDFGPGFDCSMSRQELIIKTSTLKELKSLSSGGDQVVERTWTDSTGRFRIKAKLIKHSSTQVTLLTEKGKEVTMPLTRLSKSDQEFLRSISKPVNPFE